MSAGRASAAARLADAPRRGARAGRHVVVWAREPGEHGQQRSDREGHEEGDLGGDHRGRGVEEIHASDNRQMMGSSGEDRAGEVVEEDEGQGDQGRRQRRIGVDQPRDNR